MRRWKLFAVALAVAAVVLSGCRPLVSSEDKPIAVYATFFPIYALTDAVMQGVPNAELHCLAQPQDGCLRSYELSDWDVALLSRSANAVIMGGRGLESFESTLFAWGDGGPAVSALLYNVELYNQDDQVSGESESHLDGANPHLYMSVDGAKQIVESASAMLLSLDPMYSQKYIDNTEAALAELDDLRAKTLEIAGGLKGRRVILMNEALVYVAQDYGLRVADWIDRESATNLSDDVLADCLERISGTEARVILIERQAPRRLVENLEAAGYALARIDILSTHTAADGFDAYIAAQTANAQAVADAFARADDMGG